MRSATSQNMIEAQMPIFTQYGYPFSLTSDIAPQFVSEEFENFLAKRGIQHQKFSSVWPQENGKVEGQNRTLLKSLKNSRREEIEGRMK